MTIPASPWSLSKDMFALVRLEETEDIVRPIPRLVNNLSEHIRLVSVFHYLIN